MKNNIKLSIDTLGSETKIKDICYGLSLSSERNININYLIYGDEREIKKSISSFKSLMKISEVIHCDEVVEMNDIPSEVIKNKKNQACHLQ